MKEKNYTGHNKIYGMYHKIINNIPVCDTFIEAFAGSASISSLLTMTPDIVRLNDIDFAATDKLKHTHPKAVISNYDCSWWLESETFQSPKVFAFLDPPYLHSTRPNNTKLYKYEMSESDHIRLLCAIKKVNCKLMVLHPKCDLYDAYLRDWRKVELKVRYNVKTSIQNLYMNYEKPNIIQDDIYLGKDSLDRQRIQRKTASLLNKLNNLPELERNYILKKIKQKFN